MSTRARLPTSPQFRPRIVLIDHRTIFFSRIYSLSFCKYISTSFTTFAILFHITSTENKSLKIKHFLLFFFPSFMEG